MGLILDPQLIRDLTVLITSSTMGGLAMEAFKQPIINGFFIAGSVVGPGGLKLVKVSPCLTLCVCVWCGRGWAQQNLPYHLRPYTGFPSPCLHGPLKGSLLSAGAKQLVASKHAVPRPCQRVLPGNSLQTVRGRLAVQELVQMESLAQVGVQLLLFSLGLEFSLSKLRAVRSVALVGKPPCFCILGHVLLPVRAEVLGLVHLVHASVHHWVHLKDAVPSSSALCVLYGHYGRPTLMPAAFADPLDCVGAHRVQLAAVTGSRMLLIHGSLPLQAGCWRFSCSSLWPGLEPISSEPQCTKASLSGLSCALLALISSGCLAASAPRVT